MEHLYGAKLNRLIIRPIGRDDLELLRQWRNNGQISKFFRKIEYIDAKQQIEWYEKYLKLDDIFYWAVIENNKIIGSLAIYNILGSQAEIGKIMIGNQAARGKGYGYQSLLMAMKIGFDLIKLQSFTLNVHEKNSPALSIYEKAGFEIVGSHPFDEYGIEYEMKISQKRFEEKNAVIKNIVVSTMQGQIYT